MARSGIFQINHLANEIAGQHAFDVGLGQQHGRRIAHRVELRRQLQTAAHFQRRINADARMSGQIADAQTIEIARPHTDNDRRIEGTPARIALVEGGLQARAAQKLDKKERRSAVNRQRRNHLRLGRFRQASQHHDRQQWEAEFHGRHHGDRGNPLVPRQSLGTRLTRLTRAVDRRRSPVSRLTGKFRQRRPPHRGWRPRLMLNRLHAIGQRNLAERRTGLAR